MRSSPQLRMCQRRFSHRSLTLSSSLLSSLYVQVMLAVVLTPLIINMLITGFHHGHHSLPIDRYVWRNASPMPQALREDAMQLFVTREDTLYFRNTKVSQSDLPDAIRQSLQAGSPRKVFLAADSRSKYGDVSQALDEVREARVSDIAFLTEVTYIHR